MDSILYGTINSPFGYLESTIDAAPDLTSSEKDGKSPDYSTSPKDSKDFVDCISFEFDEPLFLTDIPLDKLPEEDEISLEKLFVNGLDSSLTAPFNWQVDLILPPSQVVNATFKKKDPTLIPLDKKRKTVTSADPLPKKTRKEEVVEKYGVKWASKLTMTTIENLLSRRSISLTKIPKGQLAQYVVVKRITDNNDIELEVDEIMRAASEISKKATIDSIRTLGVFQDIQCNEALFSILMNMQDHINIFRASYLKAPLTYPNIRNMVGTKTLFTFTYRNIGKQLYWIEE